MKLGFEEKSETHENCFFPLNQNLCCDPSLELSGWSSSSEGHNISFFLRNMEIIPKLSLLLLHIWSFDLLYLL